MQAMANTFARRLRSHPTEEERMVWSELRKRRTDGLKFRRQHPIGPYIVDFVCLERRTIFEIDGVQHGDPEVLLKDAQTPRGLNRVAILSFELGTLKFARISTAS